MWTRRFWAPCTVSTVIPDREREELTNNREGLWEMYRIINPPLTQDGSALDIIIPTEHHLWLENGKIHMFRASGGTVVAMWASFRFFAPAEIHIVASSAQSLDTYINARHLELREAWLDGEPTDHRPPCARQVFSSED